LLIKQSNTHVVMKCVWYYELLKGMTKRGHPFIEVVSWCSFYSSKILCCSIFNYM